MHASHGHTLVYADLAGTLPHVPDILTETLSSREMNITWTPVPGYNHSVVLFDGNEIFLYTNNIQLQNSNTVIPNFLHNGRLYVVIIMTTSQNSHGSDFRVHWHEAGANNITISSSRLCLCFYYLYNSQVGGWCTLM